MFRTRSVLIFTCLALGLVGARPARLHAIEKRPLPDFTLVAFDGSQVASSRLVRDGKWLLLYVNRDCQPCDPILRSFDRNEQSAVAPRLVIVVAGIRADALAGVAQKYPGLAAAVWLTDPQRDMAGILRLTGGTVVLGVASSELEWSMVDAGPRFANMVSAIRGWVLP